MFNKLRVRFVLAAMGALTCVLLVIVATMNVMNYRSVISNAESTLEFLAENGGGFPPKGERPSHGGPQGGSPEMPYETRFFSAVISDAGELLLVDTASIAAVDRNEAAEMAKEAIGSGNARGFSGNYRYLVTDADNGTRVTFLDCGRTLSAANTFLALSLATSAAGLFAVLILLMLLSGRIVKPITESYEKQKQFITNAGHDLKTPLTVIDADAELISLEIGENEWLGDIRRQTKRLASLTSDLIYLSRMDEGPKFVGTDFPLSDTLTEEVESFRSVAVAKSRSIDADITEGVFAYGRESDVRKLFAVLLDNAIKYSNEGGEIKVTLDGTAKLARVTVANPTENITAEDTKRMFDRFYRADTSRSSGGGFGIGLSIAEAIVSAHRGKISASYSDGILTVTVLLPTQK